MGKYFFTSDGNFVSEADLCHAARGISRSNHKYIKREWVNGKYRYTYPDDIKSVTVKDIRDLRSINARSRVSAEALKRNAEQDAFVNKLNSDKSAIYPTSYDKYRSYQNKTKRGMDALKDAFGIDEYQMYKETRYRKERADNDVKSAKEEVSREKKVYERAEKYSSDRGVDDAYTSWQNAERVLRTEEHYAERYGKAYIESRKEFLETPLGKLYEASENVSDWVENRIEDMTGWWQSVTRAKKRSKR